MIKKFLQNFEDPEQPLLGPNLWLMKSIGMMPSRNKFLRVAFIFLTEVCVFFVITQYIEIYVVRSNLNQVLENLKISMMSLVVVVKANTFIFWHGKWVKILKYVRETDINERAHKDEVKGLIIDKYTKYCRLVTYLYWFALIITFIVIINTPLLKYLSSQNFREGFKNGTELFPHIFSSWVPFDKNHFPGSWITIVWHFITCLFGGLTMAPYDMLVIVLMKFFGGELELLRERAKQMLGTSESGVSDEHAWKMVRQLHRAHVRFTEHSRLFNSVLSPVMFLYVVICSIMLCASAFQCILATNTTELLLMAEYLIFIVAQLFIFCWHGNDVMVKSQILSYGPYESNWTAANVKQRKSILLLATQFNTVHVFTAGPFTNLTLNSFITIMKGAYSYYTLLRG